MADSLFSSLKEMLDKRTVGAIAGSLGQPEQSVSRGMESSIAALLSGLATKAGDNGAFRKLLDSAPSGDTSWSDIASGVSDPGSTLITGGKRLLADLFGAREGTVVNEIGRDTGLGTGIASTLMATLAPLVVSFISKRMRDAKLTVGEVGSLLQRESGAIRNALPAGLRDMFWPAEETARVSPVVAQAVTRERRSNWIPALALAALGLGLIWLLGHGRRTPAPRATPAPAGTANRTAPLGNFADRIHPGSERAGGQLDLVRL
jgi:OmpA-OmpF porin, OOP family